MLAVSALQALLLVAMLLVLGLTPLPVLDLIGVGPLSLDQQLGVIYAAVFLVNACAQFANPASLALIGDLVAEAQQARAMGALQVSTSLGLLFGPAVAPPLFLAVGPEWALAIDGLSFVVALVTLLAIRAPRAARSVGQGERGHFGRELAAGFRFTFTNRVVATLLVGVSIAMLGFGALNALDVFFVTQNLRASPELYGLTATAVGVGALVGAALAGGFAERIGLVRTFWISLIGMGAAMVVWSRMTDFTPALGVLLVAGLFQSGLNVAAGPLVLRVTPKELVGRVLAVAQPTFTLASLVATALAGYLASTVLVGFRADVPGISVLSFGPIDGIFAVSGALALVGGLYTGIRLRGVRLGGTASGEATGEATGATSADSDAAEPVPARL
jgi:MFS family permease